MSLTIYMQGNKIIGRATFLVPDAEGALTDPSTVVYTARLNDDAAIAAVYTYGVDSEVTRVSLGIFELAFIPDPGVWYVHVQGTGAAHAAGQVRFTIDRSGALQ